MPYLRFAVIILVFSFCFRVLSAQTLNPSGNLEEQYQLSIKLGDEFYYSRKVPGNARRALKYYHQALKLKPNQGEVYWRLSRALYGVSRSVLDPEEKTALIRQEIEYGKRSVELSPESANAHLYLGLGYGHYVLHAGLWKTWYYIFPVKTQMETVLKLDPENASAYLILGNWYATVPWWLGGDDGTAAEFFYQAIEYQPTYTTHYLSLSQLLLAQGRKQEATQALQQMFNIEDPFDLMIATEDRATGKALIEQHQLTVTIPAK
ncbi:MAG: hypothetical protein HQM13_15940 [SAR324 cluster bacterium]|nr:hypothetical protein [SAR324 cluster bacterium]